MSPLVRRQAAYGVAYITPGMLIILMFCIAPIFMTLYYSFTEYNLAQPPDWIALENYVKVLNNTQLRRAVVNTVIYVIITVPLQTLLAMFAQHHFYPDAGLLRGGGHSVEGHPRFPRRAAQ